MTNNIDEKLEQVIGEAMLLREQGKTEIEIIERFSGQTEELREIFLAIKTIDEQKEKFAPSESLLRKILRALPEAKANKVREGFLSPVFTCFEWKGLPYTVAAVAFLLILTFGFNWYDLPKNKIDQVVTQQSVLIDANTSNIEQSATAIEKNIDSLEIELNNFESELNEIEKLANDESFKDLDLLLSQIDGKIM